MSAQEMLKVNAQMTENRLLEIISQKSAPEKLKKAMIYSVSAGGKRIRPSLMLEFYTLSGGDPKDILNFACALEMIHTYSLIHDDLPCMDDDDLRRGKPSNHKVFGEANALLAGDALLTLAFETAAEASPKIPAQNALKAIGILADCAGMSNMVGGQVLDLESEGKSITIETLKEIQSGKTVALLKASGLIACALSGANKTVTDSVQLYLENIGRAFQITDDILDVIGDEKSLGKPIGSDVAENKNTYVTLLGLEESEKLAKTLTENAKSAIKKGFPNSENLCELADMLISRKN